ncbi:MAG: (2Fe-2S) ferredoxin protein [Gammaproteobacteria bacterium]|nr:(2Fe-2S) ferredoxin protein [Gammaproteobacteria bacterium]
MTDENIEVYVCMNIDCKSRGSQEMLARLQELLTEQGMSHVRPEPIMCFAACNVGPNVVIPSKRCWLSGVTKDEAGTVVGYLNGKADVTRLRMNNDPDLDKMIFEMIDAGLLERVDSD